MALEKILERSAWTSIIIQSPTGELPTGGRSAQHQWNDAQQCVTYELWAIRKQKEGDIASARAFKRAARLSLEAIQKWIRPSGELYIVKNRLDPSLRHGFEAYSFHSQYNLLAASMLATAWNVADESISEGPTPCELGGFLLELPFHHKVFANVKGLYIEVDTAAEQKYDSTGLIRVHKRGVEPLIGLSGVSPIDEYPVAIGLGWPVEDQWEFLAQFGSGACTHTLNVEEESDEVVRFTLYSSVHNCSVTLTEEYQVKKDEITVTSKVSPTVNSVRVRIPVFVSDGERSAAVDIVGTDTIITKMNNSQQKIHVVSPLIDGLKLVANNIPFKNGFLDVYEGEVEGSRASWSICPTNF